MKRNIILFPVKQQIAQALLNKLSNKELRGVYRHAIILTPTQENLDGKNFEVDMQIASCSPFDTFNRKKGAEIAATKPSVRLVNIKTKEQLDIAVNELVEVASSLGFDFRASLDSVTQTDASGQKFIYSQFDN